MFDPFSGSSTRGVAAVNTGRKFVECELENEFIELSKKRLHDTLNRTNPTQIEDACTRSEYDLARLYSPFRMCNTDNGAAPRQTGYGATPS